MVIIEDVEEIIDKMQSTSALKLLIGDDDEEDKEDDRHTGEPGPDPSLAQRLTVNRPPRNIVEEI